MESTHDSEDESPFISIGTALPPFEDGSIKSILIIHL